MDFLKKHYEKLLLVVVLLGLAVAVVFLPIKIKSERAELDAKESALTHPKVPPLTNLDLTLPEAALKLMASPALINFSEPNKLFNPMPWQKAPDGHPIRADKVGPSALTVTNIVPLYLRLTLDQVNPMLDGSCKYVIGVEKQAAPVAGPPRQKTDLLHPQSPD